VVFNFSGKSSTELTPAISKALIDNSAVALLSAPALWCLSAILFTLQSVFKSYAGSPSHTFFEKI